MKTKEWKALVEYMTRLEQAGLYHAPESCRTDSDWQFFRGQVSMMRFIIGLGDAIDGSRKDDSDLEDDWYGG